MAHGIKLTFSVEGERQVIGGIETGGPQVGFRFGRMFPSLGPYRPTDEALEKLGGEMIAPPPGADDSNIPAGYTYFGQFIDHDITRDGTAGSPKDIGNLSADVVAQLRSPSLDLDSLYGDAALGRAEVLYDQADPVMFRIGSTTPLPGFGGTPPNDPVARSHPNDLPRIALGAQAGKPLIGDDRNDENLIVAQLHLAFLKFHNKVATELRARGPIEPDKLFADARMLVTRHYQWLVLDDFVRRIVDPAVFRSVLSIPTLSTIGGPIALNPVLFNVTGFETPAMPIEFSVAAYRLGHSMIRNGYGWNRFFRPPNNPASGTFGGASLKQLFDFTNTSGGLGNPGNAGAAPANGFTTLPSNWIADWRRLFDFTGVLGVPPVDRSQVPLNVAKRLDTLIASILGNLPGGGGNLAARNLIRGSRLGLPAAQDVAALLVRAGAMSAGVVLSPAQLLNGLPAATRAVLREHEFDVKTPLWYYILREAEIGGGERLGVLGSRIVVETFVALARASVTSIFNADPAAPGKLTLFSPTQSPLRTPGGEPITTMAHLMAYIDDINPLG